MKVFLDATILYSASRPGSLMAQFVRLLIRRAECWSNPYALEEAERNLARNESTCVPHLHALRQQLSLAREISDVSEVELREKDRPILGGAVAAECSHLLTSDRRDFGRYFGKTILGVKIVSPVLLAEELGLRTR